jgi:hypothetical protein
MRKTWLPLIAATALLVTSPLIAGDEEKEK